MPDNMGTDSDKEDNSISMRCSGEDVTVIIQYHHGDSQIVIDLDWCVWLCYLTVACDLIQS